MAKRILIIEDDPDILEILDIIFQDEGFEIITNREGMMANDIALLHPDLVLLDVRIIGFHKTGAQICKDLKELAETKHLPVLLLSAETNLNGIASACGANGYISKPFEIDRLLTRVREMVQ